VLMTIDKVRKQGIAVVFITHNVRHAFPVGDQFTILNRGHSMGTYRKSEIDQNSLMTMMAGGEEIQDLEATIQGGK
jgi:simple sugar transport system ATP-binding protein